MSNAPGAAEPPSHTNERLSNSGLSSGLRRKKMVRTCHTQKKWTDGRRTDKQRLQQVTRIVSGQSLPKIRRTDKKTILKIELTSKWKQTMKKKKSKKRENVTERIFLIESSNSLECAFYSNKYTIGTIHMRLACQTFQTHAGVCLSPTHSAFSSWLVIVS